MNRDDIDALLADVISGERSLQDVEVQRLLAAQPELRAEFERVRRLAGELDDVGAHQRDILAAALGPAASTGMAARRRWPWVLGALAAAAAVVIGILVSREPGVPIAGENHRLGAREIRSFVPAPGSTVTGIERFSWSATLPPDGSYVIEVCRRQQDGSRGDPVVPPTRTVAAEWLPGAAERASLQGPLLWRVGAFDFEGQRVFSSTWLAVTVAP